MEIKLLSFGWAYWLLLVMMTASLVMDILSIIKCSRKGMSELSDYARFFIKYFKIGINCLLAFFCLYVGFMLGYDSVTSAVHIILGALLGIDALASLFIKLRYGNGAEK